jgi:hypothetical protein
MREICTHFLSSKEYLETDTRTRSPAAFALPVSGRGSSIKSLGLNLSFPVFNSNSLIMGDGMPAGGEDINGSCAANPRSATRGNHMLICLGQADEEENNLYKAAFTRLSPRHLLRSTLLPRHRPHPTSLPDQSRLPPLPSKNPTAP